MDNKALDNNNIPPLELDNDVGMRMKKEPLLPSDDSLRTLHSSSSSLSSTTVPIPSTEMEKKRKQFINRAKAMPITKTQKRARWIPGHRYMPILLLQWLWHPISLLIQSHKSSRASSGHVNDNKLHDHGHHHHHHHHLNSQVGQTSGHQINFSHNKGDLFME